MYLRVPRNHPHIKPMMIGFDRYSHPLNQYVIDGARGVTIHPNPHDPEDKEINYILNDPQLQKHYVCVTNHILQLDYSFRYVESYEELPSSSLYVSYGWGDVPPFSQDDLNYLLGKGVCVAVIDVTSERVTHQWDLVDNIIRLNLHDSTVTIGDNEPASLCDPDRSWKKNTPQII